METLIATPAPAAVAIEEGEEEIDRHESILPSKVTTTTPTGGSSSGSDILQPSSSENRRSNFSSRASTVSECESLKLEETIERLEEVVEKLTARESQSIESADISNPFNESLSDVEECCQNNSSDAFSTPPIIPKLDLQEHFSTAARPSEALNILSKTNNNPNPFRLEAWGIDTRDVQTARVDAWHQTSIDSNDDENAAEAAGANDDIYEIEIKDGSHSAPNTQRKIAPCAVTYPQTEAFINLVMGDMHGFMEIESTAKFYPDGCFT
uniref:Uncharacterized protein n=1 Tax=Panagrolaimus sp. ES5 TaxID=591445 RepID=A0AC34G5K1_9BILA